MYKSERKKRISKEDIFINMQIQISECAYTDRVDDAV